MNSTAMMQCPKCGYAYSKGRSTRRHEDGSLRRDRKCLKCEASFATFEIGASDHAILTALRKWRNPAFNSAAENAA